MNSFNKMLFKDVERFFQEKSEIKIDKNEKNAQQSLIIFDIKANREEMLY